MLRTAWTLVIIGLLLPLGTLPFTSEYLPKVGFVYNLQHMILRLTDNRVAPKYAEGELPQYRYRISMMKRFLIDFPSESVAMKALSAEYEDRWKEIDTEQNRGKIFHFDDWEVVKKGLVIPYKVIFSFSILLFGVGVLLLILCRSRKSA